jgi:hypothetical protein
VEIDPATLLLPPGARITDSSGILRLSIPASPITTTIYLQGLFSTTNPGYAPVSFSNLLRIRP